MRQTLLAALLGAILLAGCGEDDMAGQGTTTPAGAAASAATPTDAIRIKDFAFDPSPATITAGQRIAVRNDDAAPHTLTDKPAVGAPLFDTGTLRGRQAGAFTASKPGAYAVYCVIHPFMNGEIKVVGARP
jgi:plastocyanin